MDKQVDHQWHEMELEQMDEYDRKLAKKEEDLLRKKHETAHVVK